MGTLIAAINLQDSHEQIEALLFELKSMLCTSEREKFSAFLDHKNNTYICHRSLKSKEKDNQNEVEDESSKQPYIIELGGENIVWAMHADIYNFLDLVQTELSREIQGENKLVINSDEEALGHLYMKLGCTEKLIRRLRGKFAVVIKDSRTNEFFVFRDSLGLAPLYYGTKKDVEDLLWISSEIKVLYKCCDNILEFPPGYLYKSKTKSFIPWDTHMSWKYDKLNLPRDSLALKEINRKFYAAVEERAAADGPIAILLTTSFESFLLAALFRYYLTNKMENQDIRDCFFTVSIGVKNSAYMSITKRLADNLDSTHYEFFIEPENDIKCIREIIWNMESYKHVVNAIPIYILSQKLSEIGFKVVMAAEAVNEIFGTYSYFLKCPNYDEFQRETVYKIKNFYKSDDYLKYKGATISHGIEYRLPFLDTEFLNLVMNIQTKEKVHNVAMEMPGNKKKTSYRLKSSILRKAFYNQERVYESIVNSKALRDDIATSDKLDSNELLFDEFGKFADRIVTSQMWVTRHLKYPVDTPLSKAQYLAKFWFDGMFSTRFKNNGESLNIDFKDSIFSCPSLKAVAWDVKLMNQFRELIANKPSISMELKMKGREKKKRMASPQLLYNELPEKKERTYLKRADSIESIFSKVKDSQETSEALSNFIEDHIKSSVFKNLSEDEKKRFLELSCAEDFIKYLFTLSDEEINAEKYDEILEVFSKNINFETTFNGVTEMSRQRQEEVASVCFAKHNKSLVDKYPQLEVTMFNFNETYHQSFTWRNITYKNTDFLRNAVKGSSSRIEDFLSQLNKQN